MWRINTPQNKNLSVRLVSYTHEILRTSSDFTFDRKTPCPATEWGSPITNIPKKKTEAIEGRRGEEVRGISGAMPMDTIDTILV